MTLEEFRATGRDSDDLGRDLGFDEERQAGRVYAGRLFIAWEGGEWVCPLGPRVEERGALRDLEAALYAHALREGYLLER
jgi:hypothetical protein